MLCLHLLSSPPVGGARAAGGQQRRALAWRRRAPACALNITTAGHSMRPGRGTGTVLPAATLCARVWQDTFSVPWDVRRGRDAVAGRKWHSTRVCACGALSLSPKCFLKRLAILQHRADVFLLSDGDDAGYRHY